MCILMLQMFKDMRKQIKVSNSPDLTYRFAISEIAKRCPYLLPPRKSEKKHKKSHIFLPKSFADTENCRTFASQSRNNEITSKHRNPVISILCVLCLIYIQRNKIYLIYLCASILSYTVLRVIQHIRYQITTIPKYMIYG